MNMWNNLMNSVPPKIVLNMHFSISTMNMFRLLQYFSLIIFFSLSKAKKSARANFLSALDHVRILSSTRMDTLLSVKSQAMFEKASVSVHMHGTER